MFFSSKHLFLFMLMIIALSCKKETQWIADSEAGKLRLEMVTDSITIPFAMTFLPDGRLVVSDRPRGNMIIVDIESGRRIHVKGVPSINYHGDGGLLDILPHPNFASNGLIYYVYSFNNEDGFSLAVERAGLERDSLVDRKRIFVAQPYYNRASFYGSRLLLRDGYLFITTGVDKSKQDSAQLLTNHLGKVMRVLEDGGIPEDNPFLHVPGALPEIWCIGTRNAQGLTINPFTNEIWANEHGPKGGDEINIIHGGKNYGWPVITYGLEYDDTPVGAGLTEKEGMEQPIHYYVPSIAPSGMLFYQGDKFPSWKGNLFIGAMVLTHLNRSVIEDNRVTHEERLLQDLKWRVRNVAEGPDGYLYIGVDGGMIVRIRPD